MTPSAGSEKDKYESGFSGRYSFDDDRSSFTTVIISTFKCSEWLEY